MKFANPFLLNLLWGLILVFALMVYGILKREKILFLFAKSDMFPLIVPGLDTRRRWIKAILILLAFGFAIAALSGPQWGYKWEKVTQKGVDIMIALDCSKSMLAQDIKPNRLERAKREIIDLLRMMKSDRAGLVAFSGKAILQCPLTLDHEAFNIFLKVLEPGFLPVGGTNLRDAINACYHGFEKTADTQKAIIIITDGENTTGDGEEIVKEMAKQGIKIFCIGVGDVQGAPIPDEKGGFKKDGSGNIILSKVDEKGLETMAAMTGGAYVRSVAGDMDLDLIYKTRILGTMDQKTLTSGKQKIWENRYQWFLFPCLLLLLVEFMMPAQKKINGFFLFVLALGILVFPRAGVYAETVSSSVKKGIKAFEEQNYEQAKTHFIDAQLENPENPALYYNIGAAAYMNKEYDQAQKNFMQAVKTKDIHLQHDAQYNLANTYFRMGNLDEAIKGYETIVEKFPEDTQAKENLEFARQKKQAQQQESKSDQNNKEDQEKKQNQTPDKGQDQNQDQNPNKNQDQKDLDNASGREKKQAEEQEQPQDKQGPENRPADKEAQSSAGSQADKTASPENKASEQAGQVLEKMLNRLEDKPGKAMMPVLQEQHVEKDW